MWAYVVRRLLVTIPTVLAVVTICYLLLHATPGGPFDAERKVRKHIGDYALFSTGMYPEAVQRAKFALFRRSPPSQSDAVASSSATAPRPAQPVPGAGAQGQALISAVPLHRAPARA